MKKRGILVIITIALILGAVWLILSLAGKSGNFGGNVSKGCAKDEDCIKVQTTCCSCNAGGEERCVLRLEALKYQQELEKCDNSLFCAQVYNCHIEKCVCRDGKCMG